MHFKSWVSRGIVYNCEDKELQVTLLGSSLTNRSNIQATIGTHCYLYPGKKRGIAHLTGKNRGIYISHLYPRQIFPLLFVKLPIIILIEQPIFQHACNISSNCGSSACHAGPWTPCFIIYSSLGGFATSCPRPKCISAKGCIFI